MQNGIFSEIPDWDEDPVIDDPLGLQPNQALPSATAAGPLEREMPKEQVEYDGGGIFQNTVGPLMPGEEDKVDRPPAKPSALAPPQVAQMHRPEPYPAAQQNLGPQQMTRAEQPMYEPVEYPPLPGDLGPNGEAVGQFPDSGGHSLGLTLLGLSMGTLLGIRYGGTYGGVAGAAFAGAGLNAIRAASCYKSGTTEDDKEAMVSGTYALASAALGTLIWTKLAQPTGQSLFKANKKSKKKTDMCHNGRCDIRPAGP